MYAVTSLGRIVRKAWLLVGMTRASYDYRLVAAERGEKLREKMRELAASATEIWLSWDPSPAAARRLGDKP